MKNDWRKAGEKEGFYHITAFSKDDIVQAFEGHDKKGEVIKILETISDEEMRHIGSKLSDDYCNQLFWDSLRIIFEAVCLEE